MFKKSVKFYFKKCLQICNQIQYNKSDSVYVMCMLYFMFAWRGKIEKYNV